MRQLYVKTMLIVTQWHENPKIMTKGLAEIGCYAASTFPKHTLGHLQIRKLNLVLMLIQTSIVTLSSHGGGGESTSRMWWTMTASVYDS